MAVAIGAKHASIVYRVSIFRRILYNVVHIAYYYNKFNIYLGPFTHTGMLTMDNFAAVLSAVWPARSQYYNLGLALQVSANDLDAIQKSNAYRVDECFTDMLKLILRGTEGLSQDALADALGSNTVGFGSLACDIRSMTF